jgi:D-alanine transaminase
MTSIVWLNGEYLPRERALVPVDDRGFVFGDGIYEVTRAVDGRLFELERHLRRLAQGLEALRIPAALPDRALVELHERLLAENDLLEGEATVYVQVTRGVAPRSHQFPVPAPRPTLFASASRFVPNLAAQRDGAAAVTAPDIRWARCDLKTINLLGSVLAKQHAADHGVLDTVLLRDGFVTEGSHTNIMAVVDGELRTAPKSPYILAGVTRDVVLELARELGIAVREEPILHGELARLDELLLTGTTTDITPLVRLDGRNVGDGAVGPVTRALQAAFAPRLAPARAGVA